MTENEANMSIKYAVCVLEAIGNGLTLSNENDKEDACALAIQAIDKVQQFEAIGTIEECRTAVERMKPKKMQLTPKKFPCDYKCPNGCKQYEEYKINYCPECGQKLDWSE